MGKARYRYVMQERECGARNRREGILRKDENKSI